MIPGGSNMTGTNCDLFTHKSSRSYLNHLVYVNFNVNVIISSEKKIRSITFVPTFLLV